MGRGWVPGRGAGEGIGNMWLWRKPRQAQSPEALPHPRLAGRLPGPRRRPQASGPMGVVQEAPGGCSSLKQKKPKSWVCLFRFWTTEVYGYRT